MSKELECIRVCLGIDDTNGQPMVVYHPQYKGDDDCGSPLDAEDALHEITGGRVPIEIACNDPKDDSIHNYESLIKTAKGTSTTITLVKI